VDERETRKENDLGACSSAGHFARYRQPLSA
jgi:hypothetical protein